MFKVEGTTIMMNRGDQATLTLTNQDGFSAGDQIKFSIIKQRNYSVVYFQKTYTVDEDTDIFDLVLEPDDTRFGSLIKDGFQAYWYEIELNGVSTVMGFDAQGPKDFILFPEAPTEEASI